MMSPHYHTESNHAPRPDLNEVRVDQRTRQVIELEERAERKRHDLEQQCCESSSPGQRVQAWEKAHGLRLPSDATHPILYVVAQATRLTLAEVLAEQQARIRAAGRV